MLGECQGSLKQKNTLICPRNKSEIQLAKNLVHIQLIPTVASIAGILLE
jgi:hypothetical protein